MSAVLLGMIAGLYLFAEPLAAAIAELITRLELRWLAGARTWTP